MRQSARDLLAENLATLMEGNPLLSSQSALARKSGVAQTTIGYMLRPHAHTGSPKLDNIDRIAAAFGISVSELFSTRRTDQGKVQRTETTSTSSPVTSPRATSILQRLADLERAGSTSPALYDVIERVIDLAAPRVGRDDYESLKHAIESDD